ncbi:chalcone isomerase family protein [Rhodopila sp.]|uniref:chalcone isomerase family protein n=1 Tax=Rhodopila sp. TaxID=2480087 RepID=UPI003D0D8D39
MNRQTRTLVVTLSIMFRKLILTAMVMLPLSVACAAELHDVTLPDTRVVDGIPMRLNGIGLRTYSFLDIPIYVAGLYLEHRSDNADAILHSPERKLLEFQFLRDVDAERARNSWRSGLKNACEPPCQLDPRDVERFLAAVPDLHKGDKTVMLFTSKSVDVTFNGQRMGLISNPHFATVMLASFIGSKPPTVRLKRALLGARD